MGPVGWPNIACFVNGQPYEKAYRTGAICSGNLRRFWGYPGGGLEDGDGFQWNGSTSRTKGNAPVSLGSKLKVQLRTAETVIFDGEARSVALRLEEGNVDFCPGQTPHYTSFEHGEVIVRTLARTSIFHLRKGFASLEDNTLTMVTESMAANTGSSAVKTGE
jgi:hypothetical protein